MPGQNILGVCTSGIVDVDLINTIVANVFVTATHSSTPNLASYSGTATKTWHRVPRLDPDGSLHSLATDEFSAKKEGCCTCIDIVFVPNSSSSPYDGDGNSTCYDSFGAPSSTCLFCLQIGILAAYKGGDCPSFPNGLPVGFNCVEKDPSGVCEPFVSGNFSSPASYTWFNLLGQTVTITGDPSYGDGTLHW